MASEEIDGAEFQEKTGLKRKLTGPPRLLLGKSNRSPVQDEKKSRKHKRHDDYEETPSDTTHQSPERQELTNPEITQHDGGTCMDLQEECLEATSHPEQIVKKRRRRSKAGATIRRFFSCVRKRKDLGTKAEMESSHHRAHNTIQDKDLLSPLEKSEDQRKKISTRKFKVRIWHIFKKRSSRSKQEREEHEAGRCHETFTEISCVVPPADHEQQNGSSGIDENQTRIHEENCSGARDSKSEVMEIISLEENINSNAVFIHVDHKHPSKSNGAPLYLPTLVDEEELQITKDPLTLVNKSNSELEDLQMSPVDPKMSPECPCISPKKIQMSPKDAQMSPENLWMPKEDPQLSPEDHQIYCEDTQMSPEDPWMSPKDPQMSTEDPHMSPEYLHMSSEDHKMSPKDSQISPENPWMSLKDPQMSPKDLNMSVENPQMFQKDPQISPEDSQISPEDLQVPPEDPSISSKDPYMSPENPQLSPKDSQIFPEDPQISSEDPWMSQKDLQISPEVSQMSSEVSQMSPEDHVLDEVVVDVHCENAGAFKHKPVITITRDVRSSDEENDDLFEDPPPRYDTLSPLVLLNGSCYALKTSPERRISEILLAQTALTLVRAAISGAVEQLSAELQRSLDQDHV